MDGSDLLGVLGLLASIVGLGVAGWQFLRAEAANTRLHRLLEDYPEKVANSVRAVIDTLPADREQTAETMDEQPTDSILRSPGLGPPYTVRYADVNNDGQDEMLVEHGVGAHGSALKVFHWEPSPMLEFSLLAELFSGTGAGFDVGDFDGDGKVEIRTKMSDFDTGLGYALAPQKDVYYRWNGHEFELVGEHKDYTSADVERIKREHGYPV